MDPALSIGVRDGDDYAGRDRTGPTGYCIRRRVVPGQVLLDGGYQFEELLSGGHYLVGYRTDGRIRRSRDEPKAAKNATSPGTETM